MLTDINLSELRDGTLSTDRAILDLQQLDELELIPGSVSTDRLKLLWNTTQSTVSRRMAQINNLGVIIVRSGKGRRYRLFTKENIMAQRWELMRKNLRNNL